MSWKKSQYKLNLVNFMLDNLPTNFTRYSLKTSLILHSVSLLLERKTKMLKKKRIFVTTVQNNGSNFDMTAFCI